MAHADVDKGWHGLHYLFTGTAWEGEFPANFLFAGREIPNSDTGYGAARVLTAAEVKQVLFHLASQTDEEIFARFNPEEMTRLDIYPNVWDRGEEEIEYLQGMLSQLREFVESTASHGLGMIIYLC